MANAENNLSNKLRDIILNTQVPLVLPNFPTNWPCFNGTLDEWCKSFDEQSITLPVFETIACSDAKTPQWERKRERKSMTTTEFLKRHSKPQSYWSAFNYKRASEIPEKCLSGIDFSCFGFADRQNDFTFWLGSARANTPCHYDTFGVNVVVQVYGSKSWLLFPPNTPLTCTRIPYEESSVYCQQNFYAPEVGHMEQLERYHSMAYNWVLQPGDVLIVPRHWWHYVEALETSLSVNFWVPLKWDLDVIFDEMIVKHIVESFTKGETEEVKRYLLNPNQLEEVVDTSTELMSKFSNAVRRFQSAESDRILWEIDYMSQANLVKLIKDIELPMVTLEVMSKAAYKQLLEKNSLRNNDRSKDDACPINNTMELLIISMCSPSSIAFIKNEFFQRLDDKQEQSPFAF